MMRIPVVMHRRSQKGAVQVEFVLSILITIFVIFWTMELALLVYTYSVLSDAAKEGVRYAIVHGSRNGSPSGPGNTSAVVSVVHSYAEASLHDISAIAITPDYPDGDNKAPHRVQVDVTYSYVPYFVLPWTPPSIHTRAQGRIVY